MPIIFSLADFPGSGSYIIHEYDDLSATIRKILSILNEDLVCVGVSHDIQECIDASGNGISVISAHPDTFFATLHEKHGFYFIPYAEKNLASFWHFGVGVFNLVGVNSRRIDLRQYMQAALTAGTLRLDEDSRLQFAPLDIPYNHPGEVRERASDIAMIRRSLCNQASRDAFMRIVYCDQLSSFDYYMNNVMTKTQYFDYINIELCGVVINCGVDNGWELPFFLSSKSTSVEIHNIDPAGDSRLSRYARTFLERAAARNIFHKVAVWDRDTYLIFKNNWTVETVDGPAENGDDTVQAFSIDSFCEANRLKTVDVIKMDLEGAEPKAVAGMMETVERFRPQLAIATYHNWAHHIDIPKFLIENLVNYNFYMDTYCTDFGESVFYAIPREKDNSVSDCMVVA